MTTVEEIKTYLENLVPDEYQYCVLHNDNTVTPGWQPWEIISKEKFQEIQSYILFGNSHYRTRILYSDGTLMGDLKMAKPKYLDVFLQANENHCRRK